MINPSALIQQHAATIVATLAAQLEAPDPRDRLRAAKLLLHWGWGGADRRDAKNRGEVVPAGGLSHAEQQRAVELLRPHLRPGVNNPKRAATSCPARQAEAGQVDPRPIEGGKADANPMSREDVRVVPAAPPGPESSRGDADPMSRRVLPPRHSADDTFRRPLPPPAPMEPPVFYDHDRRKRWPPWR